MKSDFKIEISKFFYYQKQWSLKIKLRKEGENPNGGKM